MSLNTALSMRELLVVLLYGVARERMKRARMIDDGNILPEIAWKACKMGCTVFGNAYDDALIGDINPVNATPIDFMIELIQFLNERDECGTAVIDNRAGHGWPVVPTPRVLVTNHPSARRQW